MDFFELTKARYSVRKYADRPVEQDKLDKILAAGANAPTAKNQQPQRIYVLQSAEAIEKIRGITRCAFDAPVVLLVCGDREAALQAARAAWAPRARTRHQGAQCRHFAAPAARPLPAGNWSSF